MMGKSLPGLFRLKRMLVRARERQNTANLQLFHRHQVTPKEILQIGRNITRYDLVQPKSGQKAADLQQFLPKSLQQDKNTAFEQDWFIRPTIRAVNARSPLCSRI
ncbi:hypothetical protein ABEX25_02780 [Paenibacillus thiaminolyticus]|uniref:hypothetical protein n=1 Tax=Paenibacillus thiaminolyticus TaxID=49283 RepID=UPI003D2DF9A5